MLVEEGLFSFLKSTPVVVAAVGQRIYPVFLPQGVKVPAATYRRAKTDTTLLLEEEGLDSATMEIIVWDEDYLRAKKVAHAIRAALTADIVTLGEVQVHSITWEDEEDVFDEESRAAGMLGVRAAFEIIVSP